MKPPSCAPWLGSDTQRLLEFLDLQESSCLATVSKAVKCSVAQAPRRRSTHMELQAEVARLQLLLSQLPDAPPTLDTSLLRLRALEAQRTEMRYVYAPDWEVSPGKLVSKKGTWLKRSVGFSWELSETEGEKLYLPPGIVMPMMQVAAVSDPVELARHEWSVQHLRVWLKPTILEVLEARRGTWFLYLPHWEVAGTTIVAKHDTWLKRTTQMSGDLQAFELLYVPKSIPIRLVAPPVAVEEEWEKTRHQHVHLHRRVCLSAPPLTVKQVRMKGDKREQFDVFVGQGDDRGLHHEPIKA